MPRMNILSTVEREALNSPPVFSSFQRKQYFDVPSKLPASPLASAIRPTSLAFYSVQAASKPRGGSSHQALPPARSQSALNFWGVTLHPSPDGDVVDRKSALGKEFLDVSVRQCKYQPTASRIISGSNWRHLNRPATEGARTISA